MRRQLHAEALVLVRRLRQISSEFRRSAATQSGESQFITHPQSKPISSQHLPHSQAPYIQSKVHEHHPHQPAPLPHTIDQQLKLVEPPESAPTVPAEPPTAATCSVHVDSYALSPEDSEVTEQLMTETDRVLTESPVLKSYFSQLPNVPAEKSLLPSADESNQLDDATAGDLSAVQKRTGARNWLTTSTNLLTRATSVVNKFTERVQSTTKTIRAGQANITERIKQQLRRATAASQATADEPSFTQFDATGSGPQPFTLTSSANSVHEVRERCPTPRDSAEISSHQSSLTERQTISHQQLHCSQTIRTTTEQFDGPSLAVQDQICSPTCRFNANERSSPIKSHSVRSSELKSRPSLEEVAIELSRTSPSNATESPALLPAKASNDSSTLLSQTDANRRPIVRVDHRKRARLKNLRLGRTSSTHPVHLAQQPHDAHFSDLVNLFHSVFSQSAPLLLTDPL